MSDITVALTTSRYILASQIDPTALDLLRAQNIPMCIAYMGLNLFCFGNDLERTELEYAQICRDMAKTVFVDSKKRYIFVGENPLNEETGLIDYSDSVLDIASDDFFSRWDKLHIMTMEFVATNTFKKQVIFSLKGLWLTDHWDNLEILPSSKVQVISFK